MVNIIEKCKKQNEKCKKPAVGREEVFSRILQFTIYNLNFAMRV
ncbi:MAG: hypothetical protein Q7V12_11645 [Deltaproteobacteria bacterium]|nr:hypothetical protein [Deltaproteobacteria bacterium]